MDAYGKSTELNTEFHLTFSGQEAQKITIKIYGAKQKDLEGHLDIPNLKVQENSIAWEKFLNEEISIFRWLLTRTIKLKGSVMLLSDFRKYFPD